MTESKTARTTGPSYTVVAETNVILSDTRALALTEVQFAWSTSSSAEAEHKARKKGDAPGLSLKPIAGAYVFCFPVAAGAKSIAPRFDTMQCGRTNSEGWVLRKTPQKLGTESERVPISDAAAAQIDKRFIYLHELDVVQVFWTCNRNVAKAFVAAAQEDLPKALKDHNVSTYQIAPYAPYDVAGNVRYRHELSSLYLPGSQPRRELVDRFLLRGDQDGYHEDRFVTFPNKKPSGHSRRAAYLDVTLESLRTLYLSEWLQWLCEQYLQDPDWMAIERLQDIVAATRDKALVPDLLHEAQQKWDARLSEMLNGGKPTKAALEAKQAYIAYAAACAKAKVDRARFAKALKVRSTDSDWQQPAAQIHKRHGVAHPVTRHHAEDTKLLEPILRKTEDGLASFEADTVLAYFDYYALGTKYLDSLPAFQAAIGTTRTATDWIVAKQRALWDRVGHMKWMADVRNVAPSNGKERKLNLHSRYARATAACKFDWWKHAHHELKTPADWKKLMPHVTWFGAVTGGVGALWGSTLDGQVQRLLESQERHADAQAFLNFMYRYHLTIQGRTVQETLRRTSGSASIRLVPDGAGVRAKLVNNSASPLEIGTFEFVIERKAMQATEHNHPVGSQHTRTRRRLFENAKKRKEIVEFSSLELAQVDVELEAVRAWGPIPAALNTVAAGLSTAVALEALSDELKRKEIMTYVPIASGIAQLVDGSAGLYTAVRLAQGTASTASPLLRYASVAGKAAPWLDALSNLVDGCTLLYAEDSDVVKSLRANEAVLANKLVAKGALQVATGVVGAGALIAELGALAIAGPLASLVVVGGAVVVYLDLAIYSASGGESAMQPITDRILSAEQAEFGANLPGLTLPPSRTKKRIGTLNEFAARQLERNRV